MMVAHLHPETAEFAHHLRRHCGRGAAAAQRAARSARRKRRPGLHSQSSHLPADCSACFHSEIERSVKPMSCANLHLFAP